MHNEKVVKMGVGAKMEFACHQCLKKFAHLRGLLRHKKGHGPPLYLHCQKCNYRDVRRDNIRRHYKRQHKDHLADLEEIKMGDQRRQEAGGRAEPGTRREARRLIVAKPTSPRQEGSPAPTPKIRVPWEKFREMPKAISPLHTPSDEEDGISLGSTGPLEIDTPPEDPKPPPEDPKPPSEDAPPPPKKSTALWSQGNQ